MSTKHDCRENMLSDNHTLLKGAKSFICAFFIFLGDFVRSSIQKVPRGVLLVTVRFVAVGAVNSYTLPDSIRKVCSLLHAFRPILIKFGALNDRNVLNICELREKSLQ